MKEWNDEAQALWECLIAALRGFKRCGYLTLEEYEEISNKLQEYMENKEAK